MKFIKEFVEYLIQLIKRTWNWIDGKKTGFAAFYWAMISLIPSVFPAGIPITVSLWLTYIGYGLTALGLGHKAVKSQKVE